MIPSKTFAVIKKYSIKDKKVVKFGISSDVVIKCSNTNNAIISGNDFGFHGFCYGNRVIVYDNDVYVYNLDLTYNLTDNDDLGYSTIEEPIYYLSKTQWPVSDVQDSISK